MSNRATVIADFLKYVKSKFLYLRTVAANGEITTYNEEMEREIIGEFAADVSINNKEKFPKLFEAVLTNIKDGKVYFSIVDENGFAGYQKTPVNTLLKRNIECKVGTIFFVIIMENKEGAKKDFIPWGEQSVSKKLVDVINLHYKYELDGVYGWMGDRLIEYGKFKDGDKIIERISEAFEDYFKKEKLEG